jgi:V/A-type H+-transporting ATPase subunit E
MRQLDKGDDKVDKICEALRRETLEPAQQEAKTLIANAEKERERILHQAEAQAKQIIEKARAQMAQEQTLLQTSLHQAGKQAVELLKQRIEQTLFNPALAKLIDQELSASTTMANLITAMVKALEREGLSADLTAIIAKDISPDEVNRHLAQDVLATLKNRSVAVGDFGGGVKVKVEAKKMTLDISDAALQELLTTFLRDHFRAYIFGR